MAAGEPLAPFSSASCAVHREEAVGGDRSAGDLADGEISPVNVMFCSASADGWDRLTRGSRSALGSGALHRVHLAVSFGFGFRK
jgi:hypothetical protein